MTAETPARPKRGLWLPVAAVVFAAAFCALVIHAVRNNPARQFARIEPGMTAADVQAILGEPSGTLALDATGLYAEFCRSAGASRAELWIRPSAGIMVGYGPDGRVVVKHLDQLGDQRSLYQRIRDILRL